MKYYKIGEISKLFGVSRDILRYYEKVGLLIPERKEDNGYRYYSEKQIWKLGTIRALRNLDVGLDEIKVYIEKRSIKKSSEMIEFQLDVIDEKLEELNSLKKMLEYKKKYLNKVESDINFGNIEKIKIPSRLCFKGYKKILTDWEMDVELKKLKYSANSSEGEHFAESRVGAILSPENFFNEDYFEYGGTFLLDSLGEDMLDEGTYLKLTYQGGYERSPYWYRKIKEYMEREELTIAGEVLEIYKIDIYETDNEEEFITEIQVPVK